MAEGKITPMMEQYLKVKSQNPDAILFYRLGDFYEMFFDDAIEASRLLQITLTARHKGENQAPMCGVPFHAANGYIAKLTRLGKKVAICEQLSDPKLPGIVERDVIRIVTPGTTLDDNMLEQKRNNYVLALMKKGDGFDIAYADVTTGEFMATDVNSEKELQAEIERIGPVEIIMRRGDFESESGKLFRNKNSRVFFFPVERDGADASFLLMNYLKETQKNSLQHFDTPKTYNINDFMPLDEATLRNLELLYTISENKKEGSLLWVLDKTSTSMGGRLMRFFVTHPLVNADEINARLDAVASLKKEQGKLMDIVEILKSVLDMERIMARLSLGHSNARDLIGIKESLKKIPSIKALLEGFSSGLISRISEGLNSETELVQLIERAILPDPPLAINEGNMIADGYNFELDELKKISREGKSFIKRLQDEEIKKTGINTLKVGYNSVFGYYIEISKAQAKNAPAEYIRKQTLVNAERFITPQLKEYEEKVLGAEEKIMAIENSIFNEIKESVVARVKSIQATARNLALLDVLCSLANAALQNNYCRPAITENREIAIKAGRHPVVEKMSSNGIFIPNDCYLDRNTVNFQLITGPNMGGKSTYLRQVALITLMAQIGSFVPATEAKIGLTDRIFTRVGASDNLIKGQSTFMVEMKEASNILASATEKSLIILDEIGRGTSTYDGMSIAWAIMEYIHDEIKAGTLFATHYHELISLADKLPHAGNFSVAVKEEINDGVVFLYKVIEGGINKSYGIQVAKLAGLPQTVIEKAKRILIDLEEGIVDSAIKNRLEDPANRVSDDQTAIFAEAPLVAAERQRQRPSRLENETLNELKIININNITPIEALQKLSEIQKKFTE
jgi:DNA mismatch repair protein MutS